MITTRVGAASAVAMLLGAVSVGCGGGVEILGIQDQRLPIESRRWLADAEDAVAVARSWQDQGRADLRQAKRLRDETVEQAGRIAKAGGSAAADQLRTVAKARVALAELRLEHAGTELELALAKQQQINAETSMRHDMAVYDLDEIRKRTEEVRERLKRLTAALETGRDQLEKLTSEWWQTYAQWLQGGGDREPFWAEAQ